MAVTCTGGARQLRAAVTGEVDHHRAGEIMAALDDCIGAVQPRVLTVDLSGVTFMDSSGIAVLLRAFRRVGALGGSIRVVGVPPQPARVLKTAGLERIISISEGGNTYETDQ